MALVFPVVLIWLWLDPQKNIPSWMPLLTVPVFLAFFMLFVCLGAMRLCGRIKVTIEGDQGMVFTGAGSHGRTQHFEWSEKTTIKMEQQSRRGVVYSEIVLQSTKTIRTGKFLTQEQANVILKLLRQLQRKQQRGDGH